MLGQRVAVAEIMVGFKTNQGDPLVLLRQVNQLLYLGFLLWQKFGFVCLEQGFVGNRFAKSLAHGGGVSGNGFPITFMVDPKNYLI